MKWGKPVGERETDTIDILLEGGPSGLPVEWRTGRIERSSEKIKLCYLGGYEHFEQVGGVVDEAGTPRVVFRWTGRTRIAE